MVREGRDRNGRNTHLGSASSPEYSGCTTSVRPEQTVDTTPPGKYRICEAYDTEQRRHLVAVDMRVTLCGEPVADVYPRLDESFWGSHEGVWWCRQCDEAAFR